MQLNLGERMNDFLVEVLGVSKELADIFDETLIALLMVALVTGLNYLCQALLVRIVKRVEKKRWSHLLIKRKVLHHLLHILPGLFLFLLLPLAFVQAPKLLAFAQRLCVVYIIYSVLLTLNGLLLMVLDVYNSKDERRSHPIKGVIQIFQVLLFFIGGIIIIAILIDKSPATLFAGLGASAAVLMLIFKDSILGFVAGVQLSANDMIRLGDWVQLPQGEANGLVEEITLNTVKIRNWDNTISTIPPYTLVNTTFINWRGMKESGGRRVMKNIRLNLNTLSFCTPDEITSICNRIPLMNGYQPQEGEVPTNAQLYRIYILRYLSNHPGVNQEMDLIVAQKEANEYGVPIQVYFFLRDKVWKEYEQIQSDIFDHLMVMVKDFGLKIYQYSD